MTSRRCSTRSLGVERRLPVATAGSVRLTAARVTTPAVAKCDGSVDFPSDRYDASSATGYGANLDANT